MEIDFIITWVDGNDPEWQKAKDQYSGKAIGDNRAKRYRDWELLKYWFRSIENCAPWVHKIHFVTYGHLPVWLNKKHSKLNIVNHKDFIPAHYLPTFSCRPIEFNLHRIPGLTENFVYFNDDMFLLQPTSKDFFFKEGFPCDSALQQPTGIEGVDANGKVLKPEEYYTSNILNLIPINRNFNKNQTIKNNFGKWFSLHYGVAVRRNFFCLPFKGFIGFVNFHLPYSYHKTTFKEVWEKEEALLDRACSHKFRDSLDVSSRLLSIWQIAKGDFYPRSPKAGRFYCIKNIYEENKGMFDAIRHKKHNMVCINDEYSGDDFEGVKRQLITCFEEAFPKKSGFEKE